MRHYFPQLTAGRQKKPPVDELTMSLTDNLEIVYADLGADHFSRHDTGKTIQRLLKRLADLDCQVQTVEPTVSAS
jgi:hypothetical protein